MKELNPNKIINHHKLINEDPENGYHSWRHCYNAFGNINQDETLLALHLGFYLASWGMYRGSAPISNKDYTIHIGAVKIIKEFYVLRCNENNEIGKKDIPELLMLCKALRDHYSSFEYMIKGEMIKRKPTDTLISKIIIGTLGCSPAFDRYFNEGVKEKGYKFYKISQNSFGALIDFSIKHQLALKSLQKELYKLDHFHYPLLKIIDKYFWHEGFNLN